MSLTESYMDKLFSGMVFKFLYLALVIVSFNAYLYYLPIKGYLVVAVTLFGAINCLYRAWKYKRFIKTPYILICGIYTISYVLTVIINIEYGFIESLQGLVWLVFQFVLLYAVDSEKPAAAVKKEYAAISIVFVVYTTLVCIISIAMLLFNFGEAYMLNDGTIVPRGFIWGRLWGVFSNPNLGAVSVCVSIVFCLFLLKEKSGVLRKTMAGFSLFVSGLYLAFSDSRTGLLALLVSLFAWLYIMILAGRKKAIKKWRGRKILSHFAAALISLTIAAASVASVAATKEVYNAIAASRQSGSSGSVQITRSSAEEGNDVTNRRKDLWISGIELFETSPVVGVGYRNIKVAAADRIPDTYIINNTFGTFDSFHNMWIDLLASQGVVGLLLFLVFTLGCAISSLRTFSRMIAKGSSDLLLFGTLVAGILPPLIGSLLQADSILYNTQNAVLFWILLGYLMFYVRNEKTMKSMEINTDTAARA